MVALLEATVAAKTAATNGDANFFLAQATLAPPAQWVPVLAPPARQALLEAAASPRACFAALCHGDSEALLCRYGYADTVREAIMLCLVPSTARIRARLRELAKVLEGACGDGDGAAGVSKRRKM